MSGWRRPPGLGPGRSAAYLLLGLSTLALLSSCGGSSPARSARAPTQRAHGVIPMSQYLAGAHRDLVRATSAGPQRARHERDELNDEVSASGARHVDPCTLVTRAEVEAALGSAVARPVDAPQGPTCIYAPTAGARKGGGRHAPDGLVTVAVQSAPFSQVPPQAALRDRMPVKVDGRVAYCGVAGNPTLIVPLPAGPGRFLAVGAPCPIAVALAAKALRRLR